MKILKDTRQLGIIVRKTRKTQKLTQEQLAATCSVGVRFIRELEKGKESCHMGKTLLVIAMLGVRFLIDGGSHEDEM